MANSNSATIAKVPDGDLNLGNVNGEMVTLIDAAAAYVTAGYPFTGNQAYLNNTALTVNVDLDKIYFVIPIGGQGGIEPVWNPATGKMQMFWNGAINGAAAEVPANTDLSAYTFYFLVVGY